MQAIAPRQAERRFEVTSPLGPDVLLFRRMRVDEGLSRPFAFDFEFLSQNPDIRFADLLGQSLTVRFDLPEGKRHFNGHVSRFSYEGDFRGFARYSGRLRPWLWFLTRTADCRIFQEKTVPDIVKQVFRDHGFSDFDDKLDGTYRTWDYRVQYRETDFDFVSRLMEEEGIYYYFRHEEGKHTLVLADSIAAHEKIPNYESVPYIAATTGGREERECLSDWSAGARVKPGKYTLRDFDFEQPRADLEARSANPWDHPHGDFEIYDYPGDYTQRADGDSTAKVRLEELRCRHEEASGGGEIGGLTAGAIFELTGYPRADQNKNHLVTSALLELFSDAYESQPEAVSEPLCRCRIAALDRSVPYRPAPTTPKPRLRGPQTAIVVGPEGEEIWTDKHGRVKVQFHWDREGKRDENSSCWIRVSQPWAGQAWGSIAIPRIGQEVIVDFLEGDPDRPIVTGRVYNDDNKPPYDLPDEATRSGTKSRSTPDGSAQNFNELRFEDEKGREEIYFHAEKDFTRVVEDNDSLTVQEGDRTVTLDQGDMKVTVSMGKITVEAMQSIELKVGTNRIKISQAGIDIKGLKVTVDGTMTEVNGSGLLVLKGGLVTIN